MVNAVLEQISWDLIRVAYRIIDDPAVSQDELSKLAETLTEIAERLRKLESR
ncbi:hypothetical protein BJ970_004273 [Saccharopolyspora phatthalungensis]|uniref:Uncharacterized protein n=1 Tax=Saccharopolyspora phatthalungensis TaxID=664693 RepID=A0A840QDU6_9PSEU|nr:hypothetical protein [Saccharopolyspora phatthalungensis]